jgi:hypothetical protein
MGNPWTLKKCTTTLLLWMPRRSAGNGFKEYVCDLSAALDEAGDRVLRGERGIISGWLDLGNTIFRSDWRISSLQIPLRTDPESVANANYHWAPSENGVTIIPSHQNRSHKQS